MEKKVREVTMDVKGNIEYLVTPSSLIPRKAGNKVKMDRIDSQKLARLLEGGLLRRVPVLSAEEEASTLRVWALP